jgi:hypothetical protein
MNANACPFCGIVTGVPHETQQGCIDALHAEIARMREILETVRPIPSADTTADADDRR